MPPGLCSHHGPNNALRWKFHGFTGQCPLSILNLLRFLAVPAQLQAYAADRGKTARKPREGPIITHLPRAQICRAQRLKVNVATQSRTASKERSETRRRRTYDAAEHNHAGDACRCPVCLRFSGAIRLCSSTHASHGSHGSGETRGDGSPEHLWPQNSIRADKPHNILSHFKTMRIFITGAEGTRL